MLLTGYCGLSCALLSSNIPAHQALRPQVEASVGRRPDRDWVRSSGRLRNRWIDQLRQDHQRPPADLWRAAIRRGHTGATLRSSTTTRWRRRRPAPCYSHSGVFFCLYPSIESVSIALRIAERIAKTIFIWFFCDISFQMSLPFFHNHLLLHMLHVTTCI